MPISIDECLYMSRTDTEGTIDTISLSSEKKTSFYTQELNGICVYCYFSFYSIRIKRRSSTTTLVIESNNNFKCEDIRINGDWTLEFFVAKLD
jgi:hypothetical protein